MKKFIVALVLLVGIHPAIAQSVSDTSKPYWQMKAEREVYFDSLIKKLGKDSVDTEFGDYEDFQKWKLFWEPRLTSNGTFGNYFNTLRSNKKSIKSISSDWKEIGPTNTPSSGLGTLGSGFRGIGPIHSINFYNPDPKFILASSMAGGLFVSSDKGLHWKNAGSDSWHRSGCMWAAFSNNDPNTWYGCSNMGSNNNRSHGGFDASLFIGAEGGVFKTVNGGISYSLICDKTVFDKPTNNPRVWGDMTRINKIIIDPNNSSIAYLATSIGVYKTTNLNAAVPTWTQSYPIIATQQAYVEDIEFKANDSHVLFVSVIVSESYPASAPAAQTWDLIESTNQGVSWSSIPNQPWSPTTTYSTTIEVTQADPNILYVLNNQHGSPYIDINGAQKVSTPPGAIYTYNLSTSFWTRKTPTDPPVIGPFPADPHIVIQTGAGHSFGVSNFNSNILYIGNYISFQKSTDGGVSLGTAFPKTTLSSKYHDDVEDLAMPPNNCITCANDVWIATHGGISYSSDAGTTIDVRSEGLGVAEILGFSNSQTNPEKIVLGLDHDGTVMSSGTYSNTWIPIWETTNNGDGQMPLIDYSNPNFVFSTYAGGGRYQVSTNGGISYSFSQTSFPNENFGYTWNKQIAENQVYSAYIYTHGGHPDGTDDLYRSNNHGINSSSIEPISDFSNTPTLPNLIPYTSVVLGPIYPAPSDPNILYHQITTAIPDPQNPGKLIYPSRLMRNDKIMYDYPTVMTNWQELLLPLPATTGFNQIAVDPTNPNILYFAYSGYWYGSWGQMIWKADYSNLSSPVFSNISFNLPNTFFFRVVPDKGSNGGIWLGSDLGVFYSDVISRGAGNAATSAWSKVGDNLPNIPLSGLEIDYKVGKIRAATAGRGVWEHDLMCPSLSFLNITTPITSNVMDEVVNQITSNSVINANATVTFRAGTYILMKPGFESKPSATSTTLAIIHPCTN